MCLTPTYNAFYEITLKIMSSHFHICYSYEHIPDNAVCVFLLSKLGQKLSLYTALMGWVINPLYVFTTNEMYISNTELGNKIIMGIIIYYSRAIWRYIYNVVYFSVFSNVVLVGINRIPNTDLQYFLQFLISHILWDLEQLFPWIDANSFGSLPVSCFNAFFLSQSLSLFFFFLWYILGPHCNCFTLINLDAHWDSVFWFC